MYVENRKGRIPIFKKGISAIFGMLLVLIGLAAAAAAVLISVTCLGRTPVALTALPDPMETVTVFFDDVCTKDYSGAYALLSGYETLGLENEPDDEYAALLWDLIRENTSWQADGDCTVTGMEAEAPILLTMPDLEKLTDGLDAAVNDRIAEKVASAESTVGIYNADNSFVQEFVLNVYDEVLRERAADPELSATAVTVSLKYTGSAWYIVPDNALLSALSGGVS